MISISKTSCLHGHHVLGSAHEHLDLYPPKYEMKTLIPTNKSKLVKK